MCTKNRQGGPVSPKHLYDREAVEPATLYADLRFAGQEFLYGEAICIELSIAGAGAVE